MKHSNLETIEKPKEQYMHLTSFSLKVMLLYCLVARFFFFNLLPPRDGLAAFNPNICV